MLQQPSVGACPVEGARQCHIEAACLIFFLFSVNFFSVFSFLFCSVLSFFLSYLDLKIDLSFVLSFPKATLSHLSLGDIPSTKHQVYSPRSFRVAKVFCKTREISNSRFQGTLLAALAVVCSGPRPAETSQVARIATKTCSSMLYISLYIYVCKKSYDLKTPTAFLNPKLAPTPTPLRFAASPLSESASAEPAGRVGSQSSDGPKVSDVGAHNLSTSNDFFNVYIYILHIFDCTTFDCT